MPIFLQAQTAQQFSSKNTATKISVKRFYELFMTLTPGREGVAVFRGRAQQTSSRNR